jgi:FtsH-binding integral membrane protein
MMGWAPQQGQPGQPPQQGGWPQQPPQPPAPAPMPAAPPPAQPQWGQPPAPTPQWNQPPGPAPWQQTPAPMQPPMPAPMPIQPAWAQPPAPQPPMPAPMPMPMQPPPQQPAWAQQPPQQQAWNPAPMPAAAAAPAPAWNPPAQTPVMAPPPQLTPDATAGVSNRLRFIRLTYLHLFLAICAFAGCEYALFKVPFLVEHVSAKLVEFALGGRANWGVVLGVFTAVSMGTHWLAHHTKSKGLHYIGLALYVVAEALIFVPLLAIVQWYTADIMAKGGGNPNIVRDAAFITLGVFGALTASVFVTKKDFSFLRTALFLAGAAAMGLIVLSLVFGFNLGIVFAIAMVILAAGQILYETSQVMAHYDPEEYVGASLSLFSSVALMFWYVIQILMKMRE